MEPRDTTNTLLILLIAILIGGYVVAPVVSVPIGVGLKSQLSSATSMEAAIATLHKLGTPAPAIAQNSVEGSGKVIAVVIEKQQIILEHGEIKGFMEAMTMGYRVSSKSLLNNLNPGDEVSFTIDRQKRMIVSLVKKEQTKP